MLKAKIKKAFDSFVLDLNIEVEPAFTALFGPSGSGKTTTLNIITGLLKPDGGEITMDGRVLFSKEKKINLPPQKRNLGYVFQENRLFPHLSVEQNLYFGFKKTPSELRKFYFNEIIEVCGLVELLRRMPWELSGGEKQRVALARALLASPEYLLMDEPLAALDLPAKLAFLKFLKDIHKKYSLPIIYVSHDLSSVLNFADRVILIRDGKNIAYGPPYAMLDKMSAQPLLAHEDVPNLLEAQIRSLQPAKGLTLAEVGHLTFVLPFLNVKEGEKILLNIPASEIILAKEEPRALSASNVFAGKIHRIHHLGERILVDVDTGEHFTVEIVPATVERLELKVGDEVFLIIKASSFRRIR